MPSTLSLTYIDFGAEKATVTGTIPIVTAANLAATLTLVNNMVAAADDMLLGNLNGRTMSIITAVSAAVVTDAEAQREEKWLIGYTDVTAELGAGVTNPYFGKSFVTSVGTAELTGNLSANSDFANLADTEVAAFVTAFEAFQRSPSGGAVDVNYIKHVGRNT